MYPFLAQVGVLALLWVGWGWAEQALCFLGSLPIAVQGQMHFHMLSITLLACILFAVEAEACTCEW